MAIWGGDGKSIDNIAYSDTWEDFLYLLTTPDYNYIGFPAEYSGEKVIDLRKKGWITTGYITQADPNYSTGGPAYKEKFIYGNGWTILGGSVMNCYLLQLASNSCERCYIYDLTFKNFYIISISLGTAGLFSSNGNRYNYYYRCKFSATLDGAAGGSHVSFIYGATGTNQNEHNFYQCSFNLKIHGYFYFGTGQSISYFFQNCLLNLTSSEYGMIPKSSDNNFLMGGTYQFSKIQGKVKIGYWAWTTGVFYIAKTGYYNVYNVVDIEIDKVPEGPPNCGISVGGSSSIAAFVCNKTKIEKNGFTFYTNDSSKAVAVSEQDMTNKSYLESIYFLVGDTPTS